jgi:hypothetical protein
MSDPPVGYVVSFTSLHQRGFGVLVSLFMRVLPHYCEVELHNFNPNSIAQAAIFTAVCEGYLGIEPIETCGSICSGQSPSPSLAR